MDKIKEISIEEFKYLVAENGFEPSLFAKDYYITIILYLIKDIKGIYFKGGTALQKTFLGYSRISEDIDFTLVRELKEVKKDIIKAINMSGIFKSISQDKDVAQFTRLVVPYSSEVGEGDIFIDLNERAELLTKSETNIIKHFYPNIPKFAFPCLSRNEMIAEKIAAAIYRNKPRDHYDIYQIIKHKLPIDMSLVNKKCKQSGVEPNIIKMFNRAKKLHKRWNEDLLPLIVEEVSFNEVMLTLADYFKLKEEKEKLKK